MLGWLTTSTAGGLPVTDPVLIFAIVMALLLLAPLIFERLRLPAVVGLIIAGAIIGPSLLGLLARDATIILLGTVGLLYLMFLVGLELDLHEFNRTRRRSFAFGALSFAIPQVMGTGLALLIGYGTASALLVGAVFASHTLLAYPIASRLGIIKHEAVTVAVGGTILTEILALLMLAGVAGAKLNAASGSGAGLTPWLIQAALFVVYVTAILWGVPKVGRWFFRTAPGDATTEFLFLMVVLFGGAYMAHVAKLEPIIGALLAGLAVNRLVPEGGALMNRLNFVGNALFIPFFLLSVGMLVDVAALTTPSAWALAGGLAVAVTASKWISSKLIEKLFGYSPAEGRVIFGLTVPHASGTLAIVLVGFDLGLLDQAEVNSTVLMILVTCFLGPWLVERYGRELAIGDEAAPHAAGSAKERLLIPLANPATAGALIEMAVLLRDREAGEPLYPIFVAPDEADAAPSVAAGEKMLHGAADHATSAGVPAVPLTRIDLNVATGIGRAVREQRITSVLIGWNGHPSPGRMVFGSVLDQLLDEVQTLVIVARLARPLTPTGRVLVVCPPLVDRLPGFDEAMAAVRRLTAQMGATMKVVTIGADEPTWTKKLGGQRPSIPVEVAPPLANWAGLGDWLRDTWTSDDLVVAIAARVGDLAWHPALRRLPRRLTDSGDGRNFLVVYPTDLYQSAGAVAITPTVPPPHPDAPTVQLALVDAVKSVDCDGLIEQLLDQVSESAREATGRMIERTKDEALELTAGVVLIHGRVAGLTRPWLLAGRATGGFTCPGATAPARVLLVLLSPAEGTAEAHLGLIGWLSRGLAHPDTFATQPDGGPKLAEWLRESATEPARSTP